MEGNRHMSRMSALWRPLKRVRTVSANSNTRYSAVATAAALILLAATLVFSTPATAAHQEVSLAGSNFEIDTDANLRVDDAAPSIDWLTGGPGSDLRAGVITQVDTPSGQNDDAFGQGSKEDTAVPSVVLGGVPPNKSDLRQFGLFTETVGSENFLHLFWTRVQDPSGTTLMDFEFNREKCDPADPGGSNCSGNGVTPVRTAGDLLITYELAQGGTVAQLFLHTWLTSAAEGACEASNKYPCWGERTALNGSGSAVGSINTSFIPADETGGLSETGLDPRTFGEATVNLDAIFDDTKCESFGSAYLKSRSSDSFTAALKDFIAPEAITLSNCGTVIINKVTDPSPDPTATSFGFTSDLETDPAVPPAQDPTNFSLGDGESLTVLDVLSGSYTVTETDPSADGFTLTDIDCATSTTSVVTNVGSGTASFDIASGDVVECTYTNTLERGSITVVKNTTGGDDTFDFTSSTLGDFSLTTVGGTDSTTFGDLITGIYDVAETVPDGWTLTSASCDDGSDPASIDLAPGEDVTCTFENVKQSQIIVDKVTNPSGSTQSFDFNLSGGPDAVDDDFSLTDGATPFNSGFLAPGTYAVVETVPSGWNLDSATCDNGGGPGSIDLAAGETVTCTFTNSTGAIQISKTTKHATLGSPQPLAGATFEIRDAGDVLVDTVVTDSSGTACAGGLVVGDTYTITETAAPAGYDPSAVAPQDAVAAAAECGGAGTPTGVAFSNDPLSEITIGFESLAGDGVTLATSVVCTGPDGFNSGELGTLGDDSNPETVAITNLVEGEYTCVIFVDP